LFELDEEEEQEQRRQRQRQRQLQSGGLSKGELLISNIFSLAFDAAATPLLID
jgi:hypothetical protein